MKKNAVKSFRLDNLVWQFSIFVRVGGTKEQAHDWFCKKFEIEEAGWLDSEQSATNARCFFNGDKTDHLIWFNAVPGASVLAHEALHSAHHVLTRKGLGKLSDETEEAYAYLIQWIVRQIAEKVW